MSILPSILRRKTRIQGFIFNWKGHEPNARALEKKLETLIEVTVVNSDERLSDSYPKWIHLDDTAYFSAQWKTAVELFDADILFHIQADAEFDRFEELISKAEVLFDRYRLGVYEPNVDYTGIRYAKSMLRQIEPDLLEVPVTDCTCWFIAGEIIRKLPPLDLSINQFGWGIPRAIAALSRLDGRMCVRDYNFSIKHPKGRGYPSAAAMQQMKAYIRSLGPELSEQAFLLEEIRTKFSG